MSASSRSTSRGGLIAATLVWAVNLAAAPPISFDDVRQVLTETPYRTLPRIEISKRSFGPVDGDNRLYQSAVRALTVTDDLLPPGQRPKAFQANGICYFGQWRINETSPYTGAFANRTTALAVARLSVTLSAVEFEAPRAFGFAIKLFVTDDVKAPVSSRNLLLKDTLIGVADRPVSARVFDNHPSIDRVPLSWRQISSGLRIRRDLTAADKAVSGCTTDITYRSVDSIARTSERQSKAPHWVRLRPASRDESGDEARLDFRTALRIHDPAKPWRWTIDVADWTAHGKGSAVWRRLGYLQLDDDVTSEACDSRLHFHHPRGLCE
ncbi:MAG: hypothetical protein AAF493_28580 [Pseudomonadota bacterium]